MTKSRLVSEQYPPPGTNPAADAIYARRGERGVTPLDANLLNAPVPIVSGYSSLLEAIRTKGKIPGNIREAMILRIAALNHAAYEWIHHVEIGREEGLTTGQLYVIRDVDTPIVLSSRMLGPLLAAAIRFTDCSTRDARVPLGVCERFKEEIRKWVDEDERVDEFYVEAVMVVSTYNMVSRFLLSTDVAGLCDVPVPWPVEREERFLSVPSFPPAKEPTHQLHTITLITSRSAPWLVFSNGLVTDWRMWNYVIPYFLDLGSSRNGKDTYNILLHSQRGHGLSTLPVPTETQPRSTTIPFLATDIKHLLDGLGIPTPVHSVIGVSQGGATTLAFATLYGELTRRIVACDTAAATPVGNKEAWEERTRLVCGSSLNDWETEQEKIDIGAYAEKVGMGKLAKITTARWFPEGSSCHSGSERRKWMEEMIVSTSVKGFFHGAKALGSYDVVEMESGGKVKKLIESKVEKVILIAGELDGGGRVGMGLKELRERWRVEYAEIGNSGHLPMIECPEAFCDAVSKFFYN